MAGEGDTQSTRNRIPVERMRVLFGWVQARHSERGWVGGKRAVVGPDGRQRSMSPSRYYNMAERGGNRASLTDIDLLMEWEPGSAAGIVDRDLPPRPLEHSAILSIDLRAVPGASVNELRSAASDLIIESAAMASAERGQAVALVRQLIERSQARRAST